MVRDQIRLSLVLDVCFFFFFFNDPAPTEISPLPLPAALPISLEGNVNSVAQKQLAEMQARQVPGVVAVENRLNVRDTSIGAPATGQTGRGQSASPPVKAEDRKSTRLNSSHDQISYAVFCLKKK